MGELNSTTKYLKYKVKVSKTKTLVISISIWAKIYISELDLN